MNWEKELEDWETKYQPMQNHLDKGNDKFETYGEELEFVRTINSTEPDRVWTLIEGDSGNLWITNGYRFVNRLNYFITKHPYEGKDYIEVPYMVFEEDEDKIDLTDHHLAEQERPMFYGD
jgi:hypothetical protein